MPPLKPPQEPTLAGSVFVNNTSYAGCDIKVVVNIYEKGDVIKEKVKELNSQQDAANTLLNAVDKDLRRVDVAIIASKTGTPENQSLKKNQVALTRRFRDIQKTIEGLSQDSKRLSSGVSLKSTKVLAEIQTLSLSTYRDKQAVRSFGSVYPKAFVRGSRQIAGSMIFTVFDEHVLYEFLEAHPSDFDAVEFTSAVLDQLPPVDITVAFANEYGSISRMAIYAVEFINEGQVMSIEDLLTENTVSYVARDWDPMRAVSQQKLDENSRLISSWTGKRASDLILEDDFQNAKDMTNPFIRFKRRHSPFL